MGQIWWKVAMAIRKRYTFDLTEFEVEAKRGHVDCAAEEGDSEWVCDIIPKLDMDLPASVVKAIITEARKQFEEDLKREYAAQSFYWKGDRRSPLLRLVKGDHVTFKGGEGEVVYAIPEQKKFGVKTTDGKVLNFDLKSFEHFLFKKVTS